MAEPYQKSSMRDTFESLVVTVILAIFGTTFVVQAFKIPTGSMENTLLIGDHLLVNKFAFSGPQGLLARFLPYRQIHRDDVLVFKYPGGDEAQEPGEHFVKRVVGLPGDHIRVVNRKLYVNGQLAPASFVRDSHPGEVLPGDNFPTADWPEVEGVTPTWSEEFQNYVHDGEIVVPEGEYFVMGDNREESWDSRFWGFVPRNVISGRPLVIYWSYETPQNEYMQNSFGERVEQIAALIFHFFSKTRWKRTFNLVR